MQKVIEVGRGKVYGQVKITAPDVSKKHCIITDNGNGTYTVEDTGSTNGTYVDGLKIYKKVVSADTVLQLGATFKVKVSDLISGDPWIGGGEGAKSISHLLEIRRKYEAEVERLKSSQEFMMAFRIGLPALGAIFSGLCFGHSGMSTITVIFTIVTLVSVLISLISSPRKKIEKLQKKFKKDYACPACGWPLINFDETQLKLMGACPNPKCKVKYVV